MVGDDGLRTDRHIKLITRWVKRLFHFISDVLATILTAAPIEAVHVMEPSSEFTTLDHKGEVPIFDIFRELLKKQSESLDLQKIERFAFYDFARNPNVTLAIQTGETRLYGNIMLTIGVRHPQA